MGELKICPFCDSLAMLESAQEYKKVWYWAKCTECLAQSNSEETINGAMENWNKRGAGNAVIAPVCEVCHTDTYTKNNPIVCLGCWNSTVEAYQKKLDEDRIIDGTQEEI